MCQTYRFPHLVTGIFSGLQFTGLWNFTVSFRSRKPTMVCSPSLDLSFVTTLAFTERLRSKLAFAWAETRHDLTRQGSTVVDNGHYLQQMSAKTQCQCSNNGQLAGRYLCLICHHRSGRASTHPRLRTLLLRGNLACKCDTASPQNTCMPRSAALCLPGFSSAKYFLVLSPIV